MPGDKNNKQSENNEIIEDIIEDEHAQEHVIEDENDIIEGAGYIDFSEEAEEDIIKNNEAPVNDTVKTVPINVTAQLSCHSFA